MGKILVTNITWDTQDETIEIIDLPNEIELTIPENLNTYEEIDEYISDEISNQTGWCHLGYSTTPEIETLLKQKIDMNKNQFEGLDFTEELNGDLIKVSFNDDPLIYEENNHPLLDKIHKDIVNTLKKLHINTEKVILENPCEYFFNDEDELVKIQFQLDILDIEGDEEGEFISHILEILYEGEEIEGYTVEYIGE